MTVFITFTSLGTDSGSFNLYSNVDGFSSAFAVGVPRVQLLSGFPANNVPEGTLTIRAKSFGVCTNYVDLPITFLPTTTTTSSSSTSTTTTSSSSTTTTSTTLPTFRAWHFSSPGRGSTGLACNSLNFTNTWYTTYQVGNIPALGSVVYLTSALITPVNGGNLWFNLQEAFIDDPTVYQIGVGGTLDNFLVCP